jgi:O-antigen/teichoic acid export membrane protein
MGLSHNYYVNSFFWSTFQKILSAVIGFISVPLLLGYYGKVEYGILGIATACNGYMHLLDLGMDTGAVKFYSQWRSEGKHELISRVARTNITFYGIISIINIIGLLALAIWGEGLFSVNHEQFVILRKCLMVIAIFSVFSWGATTFNQLLIADMQIAFTMQVQSLIALLKAVLIVMVFLLHLSLVEYFFLLTFVVALTFIPYAIRCNRKHLIDNLRPALYWSDFKIVMLFSLSIFALSLFQITATQSRPIILSVFAIDGADAVAEFKIIEMIPSLIIMIGGTFSGVFLPKTSSMISTGSQEQISKFAYKWTTYTTIIVNILTIPFVLCAKEVLSAYVGKEYGYLSIWLVLWCITVLVQMHTTPGNALVLASGKTKQLVITTSISCFASVMLNIFLAPIYGVGAAIISYFLYVLVVIGLYYLGYYKKLFQLSRRKMFLSFAKPTFLSIVILLAIEYLPISYEIVDMEYERLSFIIICIFKATIWLIPYCLLLIAFKIVNFSELKK